MSTVLLWACALASPGLVTVTVRSATYLRGALPGLAAMSIWASWSAITRFAVTTNLDAWDIAALRFGIAGLALIPVVVSRGLALERLGWSGLASMLAGGGVPYVLLAAMGLHFAPAYDQGALNPGCMPLLVALLSRECLTGARKFGQMLIIAAVVIVIGGHAVHWSGARLVGDVLFLGASLLWASFVVVMREARLDPLHAVAIVALGSLVGYVPIYLVWHGVRLLAAPLDAILLQAVFQGVLVTIVSLLLFGRAMARLGASGAAAFGAGVPALSGLIAIPLLGEWPSRVDWGAIGLITAGVYLASGGPVPSPAGRCISTPARDCFASLAMTAGVLRFRAGRWRSRRRGRAG
jgi:drug/metabolite transporter (DMT)-like permease